MHCQHRARLSAFHDGELPELAAREVRLHVGACPACAAELAEIRELSRAFRELATERLPTPVLRRAREAADAAADKARGAVDARRAGSPMVRVATVLTALAASVLVIASAWLADAPPPGAPPPPVPVAVAPALEWERVAMTLDAGPPPGESPDIPGRTALADARLADWMLRNLGPDAWGNP